MVDVLVIGTSAAGSEYDLLAQVLVVHVSPEVIRSSSSVGAVKNGALKSGSSGLVKIGLTVGVCVFPVG